MAEGIGVTGGTPGGSIPGGQSRGGSFARKNRTWLIIGGGGVLFLIMSHKGGQIAAQSPQDSLQAQSDALAAQQAAQLQGTATPEAATSIDTGGAPATVTGPSATAAPGPTNVNVTINEPKPGTPAAHPRKKPPPKPAKVKPREHPIAHKPKTEDAATAKGREKYAATTESMHGANSGVMVHGREFPGAVGHSLGPVRRTSAGVEQNVTVHFGGHTETHTAINGGTSWRDHTPGLNPPSRRVSGGTH